MSELGSPRSLRDESPTDSVDRRTFLRRSTVTAGALLGLPAALAACGGKDTAKTSAVVGGKTKKLDRFDFSLPIPVEDSEHAAWFVNKKIFGPQEGIDVQMHSATNASDFVKRVATGDYLAAHPSPFLLATLVDAGLPVRIYFDMMAKNIFGFAVPDDSPITSMQDMRGKSIAAIAVGQNVIWDPGLARAGVSPKSVKYVVVGAGGARLQAVQSGRTQSMVSWDPDFVTSQTLAKAAGQKPVRYLSQEPFFPAPSNGWAASNEALKDPAKRDILIRAARAQAKSMWFVKTNPQAAADIFHSYYPRVHTGPGQAASIAKSYVETGFTPGDDGTLTKGLGFSSERRFSTLLDDMYKNKLIKKPLKPSDLSLNDFVDDINNFDKDEVVKFAQSYAAKS